MEEQNVREKPASDKEVEFVCEVHQNSKEGRSQPISSASSTPMKPQRRRQRSETVAPTDPHQARKHPSIQIRADKDFVYLYIVGSSITNAFFISSVA